MIRTSVRHPLRVAQLKSDVCNNDTRLDDNIPFGIARTVPPPTPPPPAFRVQRTSIASQ